MGKPFCTCPEGLRGDPNVGCGKNVSDIINNTDSYDVLFQLGRYLLS